MEIHVLRSKFLRGIFEQNTYVLTKNNDAIIIDAGAEIEDILPIAQGKNVLGVFLTHAHFDHTWNLEKYVEKFQTPVFVMSGVDEILKDSEKNSSIMIRKNITHKIPKSNLKYYAKKLKVGDFDIDVHFTPGHSKDSVCLIIDNVLFSGDTLFEDGIGRTDLWGGSETEMQNSLKLLKSLKFDVVYPGHYFSFSSSRARDIIDRYL